jgi:hypothetical protein
MERGLPCLPHSGRRRLGRGGILQEATGPHGGGQAQEQHLIGHEQLADQDEAE